MKFTLSWLKDFLDTGASVDEIATTLTAIGLEVESVTDHSAALKPFIIAQIEEAVQHPQADRLRVCKVNDGSSVRQVVCGAPNARTGIKVVLATEGVKIPAGGMVIKKSNIRGVESNGMLCSGRELGLSDDSEGIIELPATAKLGESVVDALGLGDPVIDIAVTPNRADALGVYGIARDLAAAGIGKMVTGGRWMVNDKEHTSHPSPITIHLATTACPLFIGCHIKGVKNGPSPEWLQQRLKAIGLRPISALVDITNYMTMSYGRPLHVFDAKKLKGNISVRYAKEGEKLKALDGKEYTLDSSTIAVCDDSGVVGLGGVIGGEATGCDEATKEVFLEAALFDPNHIARTGRKHSIESDARYRFERGVDPAFVKPGAEIALSMIHEFCGGEASALVIAGKEPEWKRRIAFDPKSVSRLGGVSITENRIVDILSALGFEVGESEERMARIFTGSDSEAETKADAVTLPSWRADIEGQADLVEEVLRILRYDNIPSTSLPVPEKKAAALPQAERAHLVRKTLAARGSTEICSWAFVPHAQAARFGGGADSLRLLNPISADLDTMRPSLLPGLLTAAARNTDRGFADLTLFEIGNVFEDATPKGQKLAAAGIQSANAAPRNVFKTEREVDCFDAKSDLFALLDACGLNPAKLAIDRSVPSWYHPTRSGRISLGGKVTLGYFGEVHPLILSSFDIKHRVVAFESFLDAIPLPKAKGTAKPPLSVSNFQASERDFAFVGDERIGAADIVKAIESSEKQLIQSVNVFDIYAGKGVEPGKKSVALSVTLQAMDRTLTDQEIEATSKKIIAAAAGLGLLLRS
jgi:phenylalanyl-tRNA synthetase beta chain